AETVLRTIGRLGIRHAKVGYYRYRDLGRIPAELAEAKSRLRDLAAMAGQYGVRIGYHNHSGVYVGALLWDVHELIRELPAEQAGSYFDVAHATVEGGLGGWKIGLNLLAERVVMVAAKDFVWKQQPRGWQPSWGALGEGM